MHDELQKLHDEDEGKHMDIGLSMSLSSQHSLWLACIKACIRLVQNVSEVEVHSSSIKSSSGSGVVEPVFGGDIDFLGFSSTLLGNNNTACRMVCIRLTTLREQSEVFGSCMSHFQSL